MGLVVGNAARPEPAADHAAYLGLRPDGPQGARAGLCRHWRSHGGPALPEWRTWPRAGACGIVAGRHRRRPAWRPGRVAGAISARRAWRAGAGDRRSEEHTDETKSNMRKYYDA